MSYPNLENIIPKQFDIRANERVQNELWKRLDATVASITHEQAQWTVNQEEVLASKNRVMENFFDYLLSKEREAFVTAQNGMFAPLVEDYVNTFQQTSKKFVSESDRIKAENEKLRKELEELKRSKNDTSKASRT